MREVVCLPNAAHCEAALMRSMREPQCLMQCYCTVLDNQVWQCVHEGWSTETGDVSGIIDQDRNWPNWQFEVRLKPSWLSRKVYCCCNDVIPSLVEIVESYKSEEAQVSLVELGRRLALPSRWMLVVSVSWRLPYCVLGVLEIVKLDLLEMKKCTIVSIYDMRQRWVLFLFLVMFC